MAPIPSFRPRRVLPLLLLAAAVLAVASPASAQLGTFDLTLAASYHSEADFEVDDFEFGRVEFEVDQSDGVALFFGIPVNRIVQVELLAVRQDTELAIDEGLFAPDFVLGDAELTYYHVGGVFQFPIGQIEPYIAISAGITDFQLDLPGLSDEEFFSVAVGGGLKTRFTRHLGLRVDGRFFFTDLGDDAYDDYYHCHRDCDDEAMVQAVVSGGLLVSF